MAKKMNKPSTMLYPVPVVMISCGDGKGVDNITTVAWIGTVCSNPPMLSISMRKERFSYELIQKKGEFVVNLVNKKLLFAVDYCGLNSGRDVDKWKELQLTKETGSKVSVPFIKESPVNMECIVTDVLELGSHQLFLAKIEAVHVEEELLDEKGTLDFDRAKLITYLPGQYHGLDESLEARGFSIKKKV
jgi:flavin reductase (DIM6/NTAB) family NADH-FMN oxidoreductase RutF